MGKTMETTATLYDQVASVLERRWYDKYLTGLDYDAMNLEISDTVGDALEYRDELIVPDGMSESNFRLAVLAAVCEWAEAWGFNTYTRKGMADNIAYDIHLAIQSVKQIDRERFKLLVDWETGEEIAALLGEALERLTAAREKAKEFGFTY